MHTNEAQLKEKFPHYWHLRVELIEKIEVALGKTSLTSSLQEDRTKPSKLAPILSVSSHHGKMSCSL